MWGKVLRNQAECSCWKAKNLSRYFSSLFVLRRQKLQLIVCQERIPNKNTRLILEILEEVGSRNKDKPEIEQSSPALTLSLKPKSNGSRWSACQKKIKSSLKRDIIHSTYFPYIMLGIRSNLPSKPEYRTKWPKTNSLKKKIKQTLQTGSKVNIWIIGHGILKNYK